MSKDNCAAQEPLKEFIEETYSGCVVVIADMSRDGILRYTSVIDLVTHAARKYLALDSTKRRTEEVAATTTLSQTRDLATKCDEFLQTLGIEV